MIKAYTIAGEIVCDPFSGSGSTAIACLETDRKFIGSEANKEYYDKSLERIQGHDPLGIWTRQKVLIEVKD